MLTQRFDVTEDVIPTATVQCDHVIAKCVQDFVHLKCRRQRLDQKRGLDRAGWYLEARFGECKYVVPPLGFMVALNLRDVVVDAGTLRATNCHVVYEIKSKVEETAWNSLTARPTHVFFRQM